jgi:insulysin
LKEPCFNQLRTNEQLGYVVAAIARPIRGILHFNILIQSAAKPTHYLSQRIENFLGTVRDKIKEISDEEFKKHCNSTLVILSQKDLSVYDEATRYWNEIHKHTYLFNRQQVNVEEIGKLQKEQLAELFEDIIYKNRKLFEYHVVAVDHITPNNELKVERVKNSNVIEAPSMKYFKRRNELYPDFTSLIQ